MAGRTLLPGFIDSHSHISGMANVEASYIDVQVPPLKDAAAIIARLETAQTTRPRGAWLIGQGTYNQVMPPRPRSTRRSRITRRSSGTCTIT